MIEQDSDQLPTLLTSREDKELRALRSRKNREAAGRFIAEGMRVVEDLVASDLQVNWAACASSFEDTERGSGLVRRLRERDVPTRILRDRDFDGLALTDTPQGILAVARIPTASLLDLKPLSSRAVILVLDAVQDPGNFGTLVRSAEALGTAGLLALPGTVDPWNPKAVRAAAGSSFRIPLVQSPWSEAADYLKREGFAIFGGAAEGKPVMDLREDRVAVVVGNEGAGLSPEVRERLDDVVGIPLKGRAESLNVAAAAAILLYELTR